METYRVLFAVTVEADSEDDAIDLAYESISDAEHWDTECLGEAEEYLEWD